MLPELETAHCSSRIRIPGELDVPVTARVRSILDTPGMQRLRQISQLGLVGYVYPGATHSRFEHCLGVYRLACQVLNHLLDTEPQFAQQLAADEAAVFLLAALLHDIGHWPYCHPIEDMRLDWLAKHEDLARKWICDSEIAACIERDWQVAPEAVADFLTGQRDEPGPTRVLQNVLGGPVDIDKMDYLQRDSLHAGVPYGRNFDVARLVGALCIGHDQQSIAITDKGKTAAEMMVFARYVMFSEVYWHHAVRSATAMLQRIVYGLTEASDPANWLRMTDFEFASELLGSAKQINPGLCELADALFGPQRVLYKRQGQFHFDERPEIHRALAGRPYPELVEVAAQLADWLSGHTGLELKPTDVLIDAPPVKLEVQFRLNVKTRRISKEDFVPLHSVSPVVKALATKQFDNYVKRVRIFLNPGVASSIGIPADELAEQLLRIATETK